ncbi:HAUS augmin-like complex subunit 7 isoform X1 [Larus michahellis]|uniref:HAUS augmin-like complex subunit 7 isoform X1 n=1 Tax=Larus michahellis TaxID=119627 RepID=UPI003D9B9962
MRRAAARSYWPRGRERRSRRAGGSQWRAARGAEAGREASRLAPPLGRAGQWQPRRGGAERAGTAQALQPPSPKGRGRLAPLANRRARRRGGGQSARGGRSGRENGGDSGGGGGNAGAAGELAKLGAELMLCRADDVALVEGTAPPERQLEFIRDLLDAAPPAAEESGSSFKSGCRALLLTDKFLHTVLETPEGGAALSPPPLPPLPAFDHRDGSPPPARAPPRRSGPELEAALGAARQHLELLEAQSSRLGGSPGPAPPVLPLLGVAGRDLAALATAFGATELRDPWDPQDSGGPHALAPCGPLAPPVRQGLRQLGQSLGVAAQLGDTAAEVTRLAGGGRRQAMATRVAALQQRFGDVPQGWGSPRD